MDLLSQQLPGTFSDSIKVMTLLNSPTFFNDRSSSPLLSKPNITPSKEGAVIKKRFLRRGDSMKPSAIQFDKSPVSMFSNESLSPGRTRPSMAFNSKNSLEDEMIPLSPILFLNPKDEDDLLPEPTLMIKIKSCDGQASPIKSKSPANHRRRTNLKALKSQTSFRTSFAELNMTGQNPVLSLSKIGERDQSKDSGRITVQRRRVHKISMLDYMSITSQKSFEKLPERAIPDETFSLKKELNASSSMVKNFKSARRLQSPSILETKFLGNNQTNHFNILSEIHSAQKPTSPDDKRKSIRNWKRESTAFHLGHLPKITPRKKLEPRKEVEKQRDTFNYSPIYYGDFDPQVIIFHFKISFLMIILGCRSCR